jgi:hypothetical protein
MSGRNIEMIYKFNDIGVTLGSTGVWNEHKTLAETKG